MNPVPSTPPDTGSIGQVSVVSPIDDLQSIAPLILDVDNRDLVLAEFDGPRRLVAEEIFQCAAQLASMTDWPEERLLEELGCAVKTVRDFHGVELEGLQRCRDFLRLVTRDAGLVDTTQDKRHVVSSSSRMLRAIGNDLTNLESLLQTKDDEYTAIDLIRLGEVEAASEQVRRLAGAPRIGQDAAPDDPFAGAAPVHISTTRIDLLVQGRREALGVEVANHMDLHIKQCPGCREAYDYRASKLVA